MSKPVFVNPFTFTRGHTVSSRDEEYVAYVPPPDIVTDEMLIAVVQGVRAAFTELKLSGELKSLLPAKRKQRT